MKNNVKQLTRYYSSLWQRFETQTAGKHFLFRNGEQASLESQNMCAAGKEIVQELALINNPIKASDIERIVNILYLGRV